MDHAAHGARAAQEAVEARGSGAERSLRCRIGIHRFRTTTNDEGGRYLVCERCGKEDFPPPSAGPRIGI